MAALRSYVPKRHDGPRWKYSRLLNTLYLSAYHLTPENCESYIDTVIAYRPCILRGYPSSIAVFAEYAWPRRKELEFLRGIFVSSETLVASERETIEATFGKKLFNWYGMTEPAVILTECEQHEGMHVNWEYGYSELLPSDDLPPGEYRLVTTGFHNPVMPFIRYETGDVVRAMPGGQRACPCGRTMPLVHSVAGRKDECIYTADGRRLPSLNFYTVFRKYTAIARFQLAQYGLREIVVRIEPRRGATLEPALLRQLRAELTARIGPEAQIDVQLTNKFITNADGKMPPIVRQPGAPTAE
jgi:phenylacetate-CoA ligase